MRVVLLTSANGWRGSGASYAKIARGLSQRGHGVHLVTAAPRVTTRFLAEGLDVSEIPGRNTGPLEVRALWQSLRRSQAEAVLVDTPRDVRLAAYATLAHRAPIVYRYNLNYRGARNHLADRIYLGRVAAYVFQSRYIKDRAHQDIPWLTGRPAYQIANGYDTVRFRHQPEAATAFRRKWNIGADSLLVLTSAKLVRDKGHEVAIAGLDQVRRSGIQLLYVMCGDGGREAELKALAMAFGLPVLCTGLLEVDEMVAALSAADLVVHPSPQEIFPNAVGEAMSCARAVVAADAGGTAELLGRDGRTGILVPAGQPEALAGAVAGLLQNTELRNSLGGAARQRIEREFPLDRMIDGYEAALEEIVHRGG
jgi:glycosyltransferase involved in cell wall biosynthesis